MASAGFARVVSMLRSTQPRVGDPLDFERYRRRFSHRDGAATAERRACPPDRGRGANGRLGRARRRGSERAPPLPPRRRLHRRVGAHAPGAGGAHRRGGRLRGSRRRLSHRPGRPVSRRPRRLHRGPRICGPLRARRGARRTATSLRRWRFGWRGSDALDADRDPRSGAGDGRLHDLCVDGPHVQRRIAADARGDRAVSRAAPDAADGRRVSRGPRPSRPSGVAALRRSRGPTFAASSCRRATPRSSSTTRDVSRPKRAPPGSMCGAKSGPKCFMYSRPSRPSFLKDKKPSAEPAYGAYLRELSVSANGRRSMGHGEGA